MYGYVVVIKDDELKDKRDYIRNALNREQIEKWAYVLHDKECYNEQDLRIRKLECQKNWADGFVGMEQYSSVDDYVESRMKEAPHIGDKKDSLWHIVIITNKAYTNVEVGQWFQASGSCLRYLSDSVYIADELKLLRQEKFVDSYLYSDSEIEANFDWCEFIDKAKANERWIMIRRHFDASLLFSLAIFIFLIVAALKYGTTMTQNNPWLLPGIVGAIGIFWIVLNLNAIRISKKKNKYVSGIPFIGGIHLLLAGLMSPIKWLALLFLLDYSIWSFVWALIKTSPSKIE